MNRLRKPYAYPTELNEWRSGPITAGPAVVRQPAVESHHWVGRARELEALRKSFNLAASGQTQFVLVSGERGVGKTSLVEKLLGDLRTAGTRVCLARVQCCEGVGTTGAYLPLIEALECLLASETSDKAKLLVKRVAPTWWAELSGGGGEDTSPSDRGTRLNRELMFLLREFAAAEPVVLFLDDLQWSDDSTLTTRINPAVAHYTGQAELADAIQQGLAAKAAGDDVTATLKLGRAAKLAAETGNDEATNKLKRVVNIDDPETGTVRLKRDVSKLDEMALDTSSTKTTRVKR